MSGAPQFTAYPVGPSGCPEWTSPDGQHRIILGDCLKVLATIDTSEVAAVLADPPYGRSFSSSWEGAHKDNQIAGDESTETRDAMLAIWGRRPALIFGSWRHPVWTARQAIVWDKGPASGMGDLSIPWKESWELIFVCGRGFKGFRDEGIIRGHTIVTWASRGRLHQNQKPVGLMQELVSKCPPGIILDPYAGSCTVAVACARTGRRSVSIEICEKYFRIGIQRMERELSRFPLWESAATGQVKASRDAPLPLLWDDSDRKEQ